MNRDQVPSTVDLPMNISLAQASLNRDRNVGFNMPIAGMQVDVGGKVGRQFQGHASVPGMNVPTRGDGRTRQRPSLNAPVSSREFEPIESSGGGNAPVSRSRPQRPIHGFN